MSKAESNAFITLDIVSYVEGFNVAARLKKLGQLRVEKDIKLDEHVCASMVRVATNNIASVGDHVSYNHPFRGARAVVKTFTGEAYYTMRSPEEIDALIAEAHKSRGKIASPFEKGFKPEFGTTTSTWNDKLRTGFSRAKGLSPTAIYGYAALSQTVSTPAAPR